MDGDWSHRVDGHHPGEGGMKTGVPESTPEYKILAEGTRRRRRRRRRKEEKEEEEEEEEEEEAEKEKHQPKAVLEPRVHGMKKSRAEHVQEQASKE